MSSVDGFHGSPAPAPSAARRRGALAVVLLGGLLGAPAVRAFREPPPQTRFAPFVHFEPSVAAGVASLSVETLPESDPLREGWTAFRAAYGGSWSVHLDTRSGAPLLVEGSGIPWIAGRGNRLVDAAPPTLASLESSLRTFVSLNAPLFRIDSADLVLDRAASGPAGDSLWRVAFDRVAHGLPVPGERLVFTIGQGNLISFGATRWTSIPSPIAPRLSADEAVSRLIAWLGIAGDEVYRLHAPPELVWSSRSATGGDARADGDPAGAPGGDASGALVPVPAWRFRLAIGAGPETWVALVDAVDGGILAFYDDNRYAQVKGGVQPESADGLCPSGCEQPNYAMPWADLSIDGSLSTANGGGVFTCSPAGGTATTALAGPYVRINDTCGAISQSVTCDADLDLGTSGGTDCAVPSGASPGNTHASRSTFFHVNRLAQKARWFLPSNTWLQSQLTANLDLNSTCNAFWDGSTINMYKSGGGCNNTGEIAGVVQHEWGHGLDNNDGGGYDNPSEAYADITEFYEDHTSCIGRGFFQSQQCGGYGNPCLNCTGIRDQDWDQRQNHQPSTPANFVRPNCSTGGGPCGREEHCEGYLAGETLWDLAARDLTAAGLDAATAWHTAQRLLYLSRNGSGGNAYNCTSTTSDGCNAGSWFTKIRTADDNDGNLANGTPHAAAIFAAFNRHAIACGAAGDAANQNSATCPVVGSTTLSGAAGSGSAQLSWTAASGASTYEIARNEIGCSHSFTPIASATGGSYVDTGIADEFPYYYRVQPVGSSSACRGAFSNCVAVTPQPFAGVVSFDRASYACSSTVTVVVRDANIGASTTTAQVWSTTEPSPQTITLTQVAPGNPRYTGTIEAIPGAPANDGKLSVADGDTLSARYIDADDGQGGSNLVRQTTASVDCVSPSITGVGVTGISTSSATIVWTTNEPSDSTVTWGTGVPPGTVASSGARVTQHAVQLTGLSECVTYYYQVASADLAGNGTTANNNGQYFTFDTDGTSTETRACRRGAVFLDKFYYGCSHTVQVTVSDKDLNLHPSTLDTARVDVSSDYETQAESVVLTETGPSTGIFVGTVPTTTAPPSRNGAISLRDGDRLTATYRDADAGTGAGAVVWRDAYGQCRPPDVKPAYDTPLPPGRHHVYVVAYPAVSVRMDWGPTPALGSVLIDSDVTDGFHFNLEGLSLCGTYYYKLTATDENGYTATNDNGGALFQFQSQDAPGKLLYDSFETPSGWTLEGEWQIGAPQGRGGSSGGSPDPTKAWNATKVLGHDLTGLGAFPGDYEPQQNVKATSPMLNASGLSQVKLNIMRQLNTGGAPGDKARIYVKVGSTLNVAYEATFGAFENGWTAQSVDLTPWAAHQSAFQVVFGQSADTTLNFSGWNIDDVVVKDGSKPDTGPCGGCVLRPQFAGIRRTLDHFLCQDMGVDVEWDSAYASGSGGSVKYNVYRGTGPTFTPGPSNLIAHGLTGSPYTDTTGTNGVDYWYVVRAENDETCGGGPNNGGLEDTNTLHVQARDDVTEPPPADVGPTLVLTKIGNTHLRLAWGAVPGAYEYHIYSSPGPQGFTFLQTAGGATPYFEFTGEATVPTTRFYLVKAVNECFQEGP